MTKILTATALLLAFTLDANAAVLTFDDLSGDASAITDGYGGFTWNDSAAGIYSISNAIHPNSGYDHGAVSLNNTAFNAYGDSGNTINSVGGVDFTFNGAYFTSAWNDQSLSFEGWKDGQLIYTSTSFAINTTTPLFIALNWAGIDSLKILNTSDHWAMDNFTYNGNVAQTPIPAAVWLFGSALTGLVGLGKRKKA